MPRLVIIDRRLSLPEAVLRGSMLEAYRVPVALGGGAHAFMHWFALFAIGGVTLQVPEDVSETAEVLLKPVDPGGELRELPRFWRRPIRNAVGAALVFVGLPLRSGSSRATGLMTSVIVLAAIDATSRSRAWSK